MKTTFHRIVIVKDLNVCGKLASCDSYQPNMKFNVVKNVLEYRVAVDDNISLSQYLVVVSSLVADFLFYRLTLD